MRERLAFVRVSLAAALLVGTSVRSNLLGVIADWRHVVAKGSQLDDTTRDERTFAELAPFIPARGKIGYLQPQDWPSADAVRLFYVAEYALTPRILVLDTSPDYLIVVPSAAVADAHVETRKVDDPRLVDFVLVRRFDSGIRLFRRIQ